MEFNSIRVLSLTSFLCECIYIWGSVLPLDIWLYTSASQFWRSVERSCRLWYQTPGPLGTNHTDLQVQQGHPILWDAGPYNRHSALWLSNGKAAGGQAFRAVYWNNWSWQGWNPSSDKKCCQTEGTVGLGSSASEVTHYFPEDVCFLLIVSLFQEEFHCAESILLVSQCILRLVL